MPHDDGSTRRDHLEAALRQARRGWAGGPPAARIEADLAGPELPAEAAHVMRWFDALHLARRSTGFGPDAIGWADILAWATLTGEAPLPWECAALMALDRAFRSAWAAAQPKAKGES